MTPGAPNQPVELLPNTVEGDHLPGKWAILIALEPILGYALLLTVNLLFGPVLINRPNPDALYITFTITHLVVFVVAIIMDRTVQLEHHRTPPHWLLALFLTPVYLFLRARRNGQQQILPIIWVAGFTLNGLL